MCFLRVAHVSAGGSRRNLTLRERETAAFHALEFAYTRVVMIDSPL